jgi:hypothetical protein
MRAQGGSALPDVLQTSPYLTCVLPGSPSPVVYAIDETEPKAPDVTPPPGAAFGVLGLDRVVTWHADLAALAALQRAAPAPVDERALVASHGAAVVADLIARRWLQPPQELCSEYLLTTAQIEITAHCNWGCRFCPVSVDRKASATMSMPLFRDIIAKVAVYDTIRYVTFHFYNEPTLDRFFDQRLAVLREYGLPLRLFTNASKLTADRIAALKLSGVLDQLVVNLPALHSESFRYLTQSKTHTASLQHLDAAIEEGLPVSVVVNGTGEDVRHRVAELRERYEPSGVAVNATLVSDRAGAVAAPYNQSIHVEGRLRGCGWPVNHAHFSVAGDMFICCNDYYQREKFGNIRSGSIHDVMTSDRAVLLRRRVFGVAEAPEDYLCRSCHDQLTDFPLRQFRPLASFPVNPSQDRQGAGRLG